jgi:hypothetical protein
MALDMFSPVTPPEWIALLLFLYTSRHPAQQLSVYASINKWKTWVIPTHDRPALNVPTFCVGIPISFVLWFVSYSAGTAGFLAWREGQRSEPIFSPPDPISGNVPSDSVYLYSMVMYTLYLFVSGHMGYLFFDSQQFVLACIFSGLTAIILIAVAILFAYIWYVPALLISVVALFYVVSTLVIWWIIMKNTKGKDGLYIATTTTRRSHKTKSAPAVFYGENMGAAATATNNNTQTTTKHRNNTAAAASKHSKQSKKSRRETGYYYFNDDDTGSGYEYTSMVDMMLPEN